LDQFKVAVFTASCDSPETNKKYAEALRLDFPILSDPDRTVAKAYGVIKGQGQYPARHTFYIGQDGKVLFIDKQVNASGHGADMVKKLTELGVAKKSAD
jgi:peroxiredoxin Q/BCP